jgi:2-polyprenyl-3-methyl-5-hydroxy-6-metoxy-1,4-benzoquinol methylase
MKSRQQKQALDYFRKSASHWKKKSEGKLTHTVNIVKQRNDYVVTVAQERKKTRRVLDVGCGTGDLVLDLGKQGIPAVGIDFAKEMIDIANKTAKKQKLSNVSFAVASVFDYKPTEQFDVIAANGFIEYISLQQLDEFFTFCANTLPKDGSLVFGSRNRLYNIFSLNQYTQDEIAAGALMPLLQESMAIANAKDLKVLSRIQPVSMPKEGQKHAHTGIDVTTRYQFTPAQLAQLLAKKGFDVVEVEPIHIHGVLPLFKEQYPALHADIANLLQEYPTLSLVPTASSFMIHARKR